MNSHNNNKSGELGFLFNVEILISEESNGKALQSLLQILNNNKDSILDYRINSGIELGETIECLLEAKKQSLINKSYKRQKANDGPLKNTTQQPEAKLEDGPKAPPAKVNTKAAAQTKSETGSFVEIAKSKDFEEWIQKYITGNKLIRIIVKRGNDRVSIPCRILNFLPDSYNITVYHVDEKQVYTFKLSEIVDFIDK